jgi:hypothetical protein
MKKMGVQSLGRLRRYSSEAARAREMSSQLFHARRLLGCQQLNMTVETNKELRDKYFSLAKQCHPDSASPENRNSERFIELTEAYVLLTGKVDALADDDKPQKSENSIKINQANHYWARMFYGSIVLEIEMDDGIADGLHEAAKMSRGGLDRGGLWDFAERFAANVPRNGPAASSSSSSSPEKESPESQKPRPFTRRKPSIPLDSKPETDENKQ